VTASDETLPEHVRRNRTAWDEWAPDYVANGERSWRLGPGDETWGVWNLPERELRLLPEDLADPPTAGSMMRVVPTAEFGVSVIAGYRGLGIGRALIAACERWAAERGVERMILTVASANDGAIRLYHELGYRDFDRAMLKALDPA
jgi:GNAT superfamily N-acetyltransferase